MTVNDFIDKAHFYPNRDIYIFEGKDYDKVRDELDEGDADRTTDLNELYLGCFKGNLMYQSRAFLRERIWNAEIDYFVFNNKDVLLFLDYEIGGKHPKEEDDESY